MEDIDAFVSVTEASREDAEVFLSAADGDLDEAVTLYYAAKPSRTLQRGGTPVAAAREPVAGAGAPNWKSNRASTSAPFSRSSNQPRIATFRDLLEQEEEAEKAQAVRGDRDDPQRLFTGGERSALAVQNPDRGDSPLGIVNAIVDKAARGASPSDSEIEQTRSSQNAFKGRGFRLNDDNTNDINSDESEDEEEPEKVQRTLIFWRNGFSIDDGPLFRFDDPQNLLYLRAINTGRAPVELLDVKPDQEVDVRLEQRRNEDYVAPKKPPGFDTAGTGQRLGGAGPSTTTSPSPVPSKANAPEPPEAESGDAVVQIRTADGKSYRRRVESEGTVQQLYDFVDSLSNGRPYILQTPYPPKALDAKETVANSGVAGAVVVQRWS